jgi:hypothetical protein
VANVSAAPDANTLHPVIGQDRVVFLKPLIQQPNVVGADYTYYDHPEYAVAFETRRGALRLRSRATHHLASSVPSPRPSGFEKRVLTC